MFTPRPAPVRSSVSWPSAARDPLRTRSHAAWVDPRDSRRLWRATVRAATESPADPAAAPGILLDTQVGDLWLEDAELLGLASGVDAASVSPSHSPFPSASLLALSLACLPAAARALLGTPLRGRAAHPPAEALRWGLLEFEVDGLRLGHRMAASIPTWERLLQESPWQRGASDRAPAFLSQLPLDFLCLAGHCVAPVGALSRLCPGDALVVTHPRPRTADRMHLECGPLSFVLTTHDPHAGDAATPTWMFSHWNCAMHHAPFTTAEDDETSVKVSSSPTSSLPPLDGLDGVPVELQFVIGRLRTTIGQLREFEPGHLLPFATHARQQVEVLANGAVIAHGEMVEIDGLLAVELSRLREGGAGAA